MKNRALSFSPRIYLGTTMLLAFMAIRVTAQDTQAPQPPPEKSYALRTTSGFYITAENGGGASVHTDRTEIGPWESFTLVSVAPGVFAFRTANGNYLCDISGEQRAGRQARSAMAASKQTLDTSGQFKIVLVRPEGPLVALMTAAGKFVTAENNGGVKARGTRAVSTDRQEIGPWEQFQLVDIEREQRRKAAQ